MKTNIGAGLRKLATELHGIGYETQVDSYNSRLKIPSLSVALQFKESKQQRNLRGMEALEELDESWLTIEYSISTLANVKALASNVNLKLKQRIASYQLKILSANESSERITRPPAKATLT